MSQVPDPPLSSNIADIKNGPLARAGQALIGLYLDYQDYIQAGASGTFTSQRSPDLRLDGTQVFIMAQGTDLSSLSALAERLGLRNAITDPATRTIQGFLPIEQLPILAQADAVLAIHPVTIPKTSSRNSPTPRLS